MDGSFFVALVAQLDDPLVLLGAGFTLTALALVALVGTRRRRSPTL